MIFSLLILGYLGPETMLPVTSVVAGAAGVAMLLGRGAARWAFGLLRRLAAIIGLGPKPRPRARRIGTGPVGPIARERVRA